MPPSIRRPKQPDVVRAAAISAALDLLSDEGFDAITLDAVARRAGISKGGLQHHFRTKAALLDGVGHFLADEFMAQLEQAYLAEEDRPGRRARAYIKVNFQPVDPRWQKAINVLAAHWPEGAERWQRVMQEELAQDRLDAPEGYPLLLAARLAADGYWFSQMIDIYRMDEALRASLLSSLLAMCDGVTK